MKKESYTQGEWELRGNKIFIAGTYNSIATVHIQKSWDEQIRPIEDVEAKANAKLIASAPKLKEENESLKRLLVSLTPGGSEFVDNPEYCIKYVNDYQKEQLRIIQSLIVQKKKLIKENYELLEALKELYDFNLNDIGYLDIALNHAESAIKKATE